MDEDKMIRTEFPGLYWKPCVVFKMVTEQLLQSFFLNVALCMYLTVKNHSLIQAIVDAINLYKETKVQLQIV